MEFPICELRDMAGLTVQVVEQMFNHRREGSEDLYRIAEFEVERAMFAVSHLLKMINEVHDKYYAVAEGRVA